MASYLPTSNGLVECTDRKILEILCLVVGELLEMWEDWLSHIIANINSSICECMGQSPLYIIFRVEKRLPYDLLSSLHTPVYNVGDYIKCQINIFSDIHKLVKEEL